MIEYSTHNIDPSMESSFLQLKSSFGWQVVDSNEVYSENTYVSDVSVTTYGDGLIGGFMSGFTGSDGKVQVNTKTDVTNYIHITLARDTGIPDYAKIRENEDMFWICAGENMPSKPIAVTAICTVATLLIIVSVIMGIANGTAVAAWEIAVCVAVPIVAALVLFLVWRRYRRKVAHYYFCMRHAEELLEESQQLVHGN